METTRIYVKKKMAKSANGKQETKLFVICCYLSKDCVAKIDLFGI